MCSTACRTAADIQTVATECKGDGDLLQSLALENTKTGEKSELQVNGLFYAIGMSLFALFKSCPD
jgi:thioredoxin reductase